MSLPLTPDTPPSASPVRVVLMARTLGLGGSERQVTEIALSLDRRRFAPTVACFDGSGFRGDQLRAADVPVLDLGVRSFRSVASIRIASTFVAMLRDTRTAIVHPFDVPTVLFGVPLARVAGVPVVLSSQRGDRRLFSRPHRWALKLTDPLVDGIVVNSNYVRQLLAKQGVADRKLHICHNSLDTTAFQPRDHAASHLRNGHGCVIGIVAALRPEKSIETLIEAFANLAGDHRLVIVGEGPCREPLLSRARDLGIAERSSFLPKTSDVGACYRSLDIFVLPSTNESFSNSLMEAMACGCAVVASDAGGNTELVRNEVNGLVFEAGNIHDLTRALTRLVENPEWRKRLGSNAVETIHRGYSRQVAARCFEELYDTVLGRKQAVDGR